MTDRCKETQLVRDGVFNVRDELGRQALAERIAADASAEAPTSRIVGVFGGWGTGKTHLLRMVGGHLCAQRERFNATVALFPAWKYELERDVGLSFLSALSYSKSYPLLGRTPTMPPGAAEVARSLFGLLAGLASPLAGSSPEAAAIAGGAGAVARLLADTSVADLPRVEAISQQFEKLVKAILEADRERPFDRLVVLVDDLDRCSPDRMVDMFEWMKVHLDVPRCNFVVALDHRAAAHAIAGRYKKFLSSDRDVSFGYRYLDKLFHSSFELAGSPKVQAMAVKRAFAKHTPVPDNFSDAAQQVMGGDFPLRAWLSDVVNLPVLRAARTMLHVAFCYHDVLGEYRAHAQTAGTVPGQLLPRDTPFWLLLLVCMQCTLSPDELDSFVHHQGIVFDGAIASPPGGRTAADLDGLTPDRPERQFGLFLRGRLRSTGQVAVPSQDALRRMLELVRQRMLA